MMTSGLPGRFAGLSWIRSPERRRALRTIDSGRVSRLLTLPMMRLRVRSSTLSTMIVPFRCSWRATRTELVWSEESFGGRHESGYPGAFAGATAGTGSADPLEVLISSSISLINAVIRPARLRASA